MVPTGSALRRVNLEVRVVVNGKSLAKQRSYSRIVADKAGNELDREEEVIIRGARTVSDTRLKPDEEREEIFRFPVPPARRRESKRRCRTTIPLNWKIRTRPASILLSCRNTFQRDRRAGFKRGIDALSILGHFPHWGSARRPNFRPLFELRRLRP